MAAWTTIKSKTLEKTVPETTIEARNRRIGWSRRAKNIVQISAGRGRCAKRYNGSGSSAILNSLVCDEAL
jgi:hypothetical protein